MQLTASSVGESRTHKTLVFKTRGFAVCLLRHNQPLTTPREINHNLPNCISPAISTIQTHNAVGMNHKEGLSRSLQIAFQSAAACFNSLSLSSCSPMYILLLQFISISGDLGLEPRISIFKIDALPFVCMFRRMKAVTCPS